MSSRIVRTSHDDLTYRIIGCAMALHRALGPGLREDSYQRGLEVRLMEAGLAFEAQKLIEIYDQGVLVGYYVPDLIVAGQVVVELKALDRLDNAHVAQVIGYLTVTGSEVGLLFDFGGRSLRWKRILPPRERALHNTINRQWLFVPSWIERKP